MLSGETDGAALLFSDEDKTIFDWCRGGNRARVSQLLAASSDPASLKNDEV